MLCNICSNIHFKPIENCELIQREPYRMRQDQQDVFIDSVFYFHHKDKRALESSADQGCHFCGMLWLNLFEDDDVILRDSPRFVFARGEIILRRDVMERSIQEESEHERWNREYWISVHYEEKYMTTSNILDYQGKPHSTPKVRSSAKSSNRQLHNNA
jgi:hypothetical protein